MYKELLMHLNNVEKEYGECIRLANEIFDLIKLDKIMKLPELNQKQTQYMNELKKKREELKEFVKSVAIVNNVDDYRVQALTRFLNVEEKERVVDKQKALMLLEKELSQALVRNGEYLSVVLSVKEAKMDAIIQLNERENKEHNIFLNEKY